MGKQVQCQLWAPTEIATMDSVVTDMNSANYIGHVQEGFILGK